MNKSPETSSCTNSHVCVICDMCPPLSRSAIYDVVEEKADSEPDFQYIPEKSPQDPTQLDQHALRDSMVALKDGLGGGAILAQFDVRGTTQRLTHSHSLRHTHTHTHTLVEVQV